MNNQARQRRGGMLLALLAAILPLLLAADCAPSMFQDCSGNAGHRRPEALRAVQVDLDYVYDPDPGQEARNLHLLVKRVERLGVNTVFVQAFADPDGNDGAEELYFPNRHLPMRRDLLARATDALKKTGVRVLAWMPLLAFTLPSNQDNLLVQAHSSLPEGTAAPRAPRLSPFHPAARSIIMDIYEDLAESARFDGILFHDDSILSDYEDASPAAIAAYQRAGFPADIASIRANPVLMRRWSRFKTKYLINFSLDIVRLLRRKHPGLLSARDIYGRAIVQPESEQWLAQYLPLFLQAYDYTVILAMPYLEQASDPERWLAALADQALSLALGPASLVFQLQSVDWRRKARIPTSIMLKQLALLRRHGITSVSYYPDDFFHDHPQACLFKQAMSEGQKAETRARF